MIKRIVTLLFVFTFLTACHSEDEKVMYFEAVSENWKAQMTATFPPPPENNAEIVLSYVYEGEEEKTHQKVIYNQILEWNDADTPSIISEEDSLPTEDNETDILLNDTKVFGGYDIGQKWITEVTWLEDGEEKTERLVFESVDTN